MDIVVEEEFPALRQSGLSKLTCSLWQRPDLYLRLKKDACAQIDVEVCSSPYEDTIRKCLIGTTDQLRLRTMYNPEARRVTGFCFPKLPTQSNLPGKKGCVVEVEVCWEDWAFQYRLTPLTNPKQVKEEIIKAVNGLQALGCDCVGRHNIVLQLSQHQLQRFSENTHQVLSENSILIQISNAMYKLPL